MFNNTFQTLINLWLTFPVYCIFKHFHHVIKINNIFLFQMAEFEEQKAKKKRKIEGEVKLVQLM